MTKAELSTFIKKEALKLGFDACGMAQAAPIRVSESAKVRSWLDAQFHAEMHYMENHFEKRQNPKLLVDDCQSIIVVALNYNPTIKRNPKLPTIAKFAYGKDYHFLIRDKLQKLLRTLKKVEPTAHGRTFSDSAPITERYWATEAGLGWIGKNRNLILPGKGSYFLLGELFLNLELEYDTPIPSRCGSCRRCLDACPTSALSETFGLNSNRCLSYLTIEKRGAFDSEESFLVGNNDCVFGCDGCQDCCPWNRFAQDHSLKEFQPKTDFLTLDIEAITKMDENDFNAFFSDTCLDRTGLEGLLRNAESIKKVRSSLTDNRT